MFNAFIPGLRKTLNLFHEAEARPFKDKMKWLILQEQLIKQITATEKRIRCREATSNPKVINKILFTKF